MSEQTLSAPPVVKSAHATFLYDIATLLNVVYHQSIEPTREGNVPKRQAGKLTALLKGQSRGDEGSFVYLNMLLDAMLELEILDMSNPILAMKQRIIPGPRASAWGNLSFTAQIRQFMNIWLYSPPWFDHPTDAKSYYGGFYGSDLLKMRQLIVQELSTLPVSQWSSVSDLLEEIRAKNPIKHIPYDYGNGYYSARSQPKPQSPSETKNLWYQYLAPLYLNILQTTFLEFSFVELGFPNTEAEQPTMVLVTPFGREVATKDPKISNEDFYNQPAPITTAHIVVQPNFDILLLQEDVRLLYALLPFAEARQLGPASTLRLTQQSIQHGLNSGLSIEQMLTLLTTHSQKDLPQNVVYSLHDWAKKYHVAHIGMAVILEVDSAEQATALCNNEVLKKAGVRQVAPCILLVQVDSNLQQVRNTLEKEGITVQFNPHFPPMQLSTYH